ncbi:MAG: AAA family ATPase [Paracoccaceae bacterium]
MNTNFILITGCSGGGKSTLLDALGRHGFAISPEPGRRVIASELAGSGGALPWVDMAAFASRAIETARADLEAAREFDGPVFFDRGLIDAAVACEHSGGPPAADTLGEVRHYAKQVFVVPPWKELFANDAARRHDFSAAVQEYDRILCALDDLGYDRFELPRVGVADRVEIVLQERRADCG